LRGVASITGGEVGPFEDDDDEPPLPAVARSLLIISLNLELAAMAVGAGITLWGSIFQSSC